MFVDRLENAALYYGLGERIAVALRYPKVNDCTKLSPGRHLIRGEQAYALVQDNITKPREQGK